MPGVGQWGSAHGGGEGGGGEGGGEGGGGDGGGEGGGGDEGLLSRHTHTVWVSMAPQSTDVLSLL